MARKKAEVNADVVKTPKVRKKKDVDKQQNLEDILYECRNKLRGNANMTTKRDMLLTLVFLRFIGSRYNEQREKIRKHLIKEFSMDAENLAQEDKEYLDQMLEDRASYQKDGVFYLKDDYNWDCLIKIPAADRALALDNGISGLMKTEKDLKNALPSNLFVNAHLEPSVLKGVMDDINKIDPANFKDIDLIGRVYEYFLQQFAVNAEKEDGEFYTPQSIVELIANLIEPFDGTIYDPCCGSGGMFVQSVRLVEAHGGNKRNVTVYGQESDPDTYRLAKMNLAARGISYHLGDTNASSFTADKHPTLRADYIMANPPFNKHDWRTDEELTKDMRWKGYGLPPVSNANYAWILHMLFHLDKTHGIAGFLLSNGALEDEDAVKIREQLIKNDKVEAIFILPREMFYQVDLSVTLWVINQNKKGGLWHGRNLRNREGEVLFVDLRQWNQNHSTIKTDKSKKTFVVFDEEQINKIAEIYHGWQTRPSTEYDVPELCYSANISEIKQCKWSLVPSNYIKLTDIIPETSKGQTITFANTALKEIEQTQLDSIKRIQNAPKLDEILGGCTNIPIVELGKFIEETDDRNDQGLYNLENLRGVSIDKKFIPSKANMEGVSLLPYKIVRPENFCFVTITSRNSDKITIAKNGSKDDYIVSSSYVVFRVKDKEALDPDYLLIWFKRSEFDRYARFHSWGSTRESFSYEDMEKVRIPLPDIKIQRAIVNIYQCAEDVKKIAATAELLSKEICPSLMQHMFIESKTSEQNNKY